MLSKTWKKIWTNLEEIQKTWRKFPKNLWYMEKWRLTLNWLHLWIVQIVVQFVSQISCWYQIRKTQSNMLNKNIKIKRIWKNFFILHSLNKDFTAFSLQAANYRFWIWFFVENSFADYKSVRCKKWNNLKKTFMILKQKNISIRSLIRFIER